MDSEFANFFAEQEANMENQQHQPGNAEPSSWSTQDGEDTDVVNQILDQSDQPYGSNVDEMDGDALATPQDAANESGISTAFGGGGYSPSAVPYEQQERGYSPSAPVFADQGYSPSNVVTGLPGSEEADKDGSELQDTHNTHSAQQFQMELRAHPNTPPASTTKQETKATPAVIAGQFQPAAPGLSVESADSTPLRTPVPEQVAPAPAPVLDTTPKTPYETAQARARENKHDHGAWIGYLTLAENTADLEIVKDVYEEALLAFPNTASIQIAYLNHFLAPALFQRAEALFARFLKPSPSVELWKFYLTYVRRINPNVTEQKVRDTVRQAYEFALSHVGHDMESGQIWKDYLDFLKNALDSRTTWDAQQRMDALRSVYHRAVVVPLDNVEVLWRELDQYENSLNKITAKKFLQDLSPGYMTAKTALRDLKRLLTPIATPTSSTATSPSMFNLPPYPTWASDSDRALAQAWKAYLKWEEGNPLDLDDNAALQLRITSAYKKAAARMRFYPEITFMTYNSLMAMNKYDEAIAVLKQGIEARPSSFVLSFALAELMETQKNLPAAHAAYDALITTLSKNLDALDAQIKVEVEDARASVLQNSHNGTVDDSTPAVVEAEDRARKVKERRSKDLEAAKSELGIVWIMLMRFARRAEGPKPARVIFAKARRDKWSAWCVYEAAALMEYHCTKAPVVAINIFEAGLKVFADDVEYVTRYLAFLININDDNNARALFERVIGTFTPAKGRPLWERWARYEYHFSDLAATQKLEQRMAEAFPSDPPIKRFAHKYTYLGIDAVASRDLGFSIKATSGSQAPPRVDPPPPPPVANDAAAAIVANNSGNHKRGASPARRRDPSPPSKRFKGGSPPPGPRGRNWERERDRSQDMGGRRPYSPRRKDVDAVPEGVAWFMGTLPSAVAFDGPRFRTEDLMHLFKTANGLPTPPDPRRSRSPPPRAGRPPPDYGPYQGPGGGGGRGGRRY
ncbi:mRNA 3'-end-processing protein rna14 [Tulasnella sp. 331]|nr:mRNA 3'-end-processing protein rna14 [Tulasnella sp. 331]